jgi:hypothetical protein
MQAQESDGRSWLAALVLVALVVYLAWRLFT